VEPTRLPNSIRKRDGQVVPFEPERLSRSLFAATEALGAPDAFLARELADGVIHFLASETHDEPPTSTQLAELVVKVVRELGHPALAKTYDERRRLQPRAASQKATLPIESPPGDPFKVLAEAARDRLSDYSLNRIYPRDLASAHREGLLQLLDLDVPHEMSGIVLSPNQPLPLDGWELLETLVRARGVVGSYVGLDGPEHAIAIREGIPEEMASGFLAVLDRALRLTQLRGILNLNAGEAPPWAAPLTMGPLFQEFQKEMEDERLDRIALYLLRHARQQPIWWHFSERDFREERSSRLREIVRRSTTREGVEFVFDRPRKPIALGPGIDRRNPAALGVTGINLSRFVDQLGGGPLDAATYLKKLASLARFAKSAGHARQDYLRKQGRAQLLEGFLLERASQIVLPVGSADAARKVLGVEGSLDAVGELAGQSVEAVRIALETDQPRSMSTRIDSPLEAPAESERATAPALLPRQQLKFAMPVYAAGGCLTIFLKQSDPAGVNQLPELLHAAWRGSVLRLRFAWMD
jgi:hypothetical protein